MQKTKMKILIHFLNGNIFKIFKNTQKDVNFLEFFKNSFVFFRLLKSIVNMVDKIKFSH